MLNLLIFVSLLMPAALAQSENRADWAYQPANWTVRNEHKAQFERLLSGPDTNLDQFRRFEQMLAAQGYSVSEARLYLDMGNSQAVPCTETEAGDPKCETRPFHYVKLMVKGESKFYLEGEGAIRLRPPSTLIRVEMDTEGITRENRLR